MAVKTTFQVFWTRHLEPKARRLGAQDADIEALKSKAKSLIVDAGWGDLAGKISCISKQDFSACLKASIENLGPSVQKVVTARQDRANTAAATVGINLSASTMPTFQSANFNPVMAQVGEACPRCSSAMIPVNLVNGRAGVYCQSDRVVLPVW